MYDSEENIYKERLINLNNKKFFLTEKQILIEIIIANDTIDKSIKQIFLYNQTLNINIGIYLKRKRENKWFGDESDKEIEKIIFQSINKSDDNFWEEFEKEINNIKNILKDYIAIK